jgi:large subunit ribosomal protein L7/L12
MHVKALVLGAMIWLSAVGLSDAQTANGQNAEQILPADKAPVGTPLRRPDSFPHYQLSNLRKGGGQLRPAEFSLDYVRDVDGAGFYSVILVANGANGRKEYSSWGPFAPFRDKSGTVSAEASFSPFAKNLGDQFEIWLEAQLGFENKSYRFKVSNSVVVGNVGQLSLARNWTAEEQQGIERWQKSVTPPPAPPAGHVAIAQDTKLVPGMPILAGWMAGWEPAEVIDVRKDSMVLVKYKPETSSTMIIRPRNWLSVDSNLLQTAKASPAKFQPSVKVLPSGMLPIDDGLVPLGKDVKLVKGAPLRMEFANKWAPVTVVKVLVDGRVRIHWDEWKGHADEDKPRDVLVIETETLTALNDPGAAEKFAARATETAGSFEGSTPDQPRQLQQYPINIPIPKTAVKVTAETALLEGTKLGCSWGSNWHDVTVIDVHDDGTVRIHWDKFGDAWDGDISRDSLIIDKKVLAKLPKPKAKAPAKSAVKGPAKGASKDASKEDVATSTPKAAEEGEFQVVLNGFGKNKFAVIKVVMEITGLDLKDAKELVENTPISLKQGIAKPDADKLLKKITAAGGTGEVKEP